MCPTSQDSHSHVRNGEEADMPEGQSPLPSGTITFLFTDIEGSTRRWEVNRDAMAGAVARHDALLREIFERHEGYIFKTVGDAFCVAFRTAPRAVAAAVEAQRAMAAQDHRDVEGLYVRMGLHCGPAYERDGDYFGPTVNRVARLVGIGHGGQILLSEAARALVAADLPAGVMLVDLGFHRLKDLEHAEHVWSVGGEGFATAFPPLHSLDLLPNNLPQHVTRFYGREQEADELAALLAEHRLVSVLGPGGIGKTRLAVQVGANLLERYPDGVWFADLAGLRWPDLAASVVSKTLGIAQAEHRSIDDSVALWLRRKRLLLILDNCEHIVDDVARLADFLLTQCPTLSVLATTRQPLGVAGEHVLRVAPLRLPAAGVAVVASAIDEYPAVALFVERARAANAAFAPSDDDAFLIAEICRHLDGLPLAIELAAARVKVLSLEGLAQRLDRRFALLTGGSRTALPRQRALSALIDWSYDLLTAKEQRLFARLSVFAGSLSLEAAEAVCAGGDLEADEMLDLVTSLADKSLLVAEIQSRSERYRLLESLRAYGADKCRAFGDDDTVAERHAEYYAGLVLGADRSYGMKPDGEWLQTVEPDVDNFRAVLEWSLGPGNKASLGGRVAGSLERLWREGGLEAEGRRWIEKALAACREDDDPRVCARLWRALAWLTSGKRSYEAAQRACDLYESVADEAGLAHALHVLAWGLCHLGQYDRAEVANDRALGWFKQHADRRHIAACLRQQAAILEARGDSATARQLHVQALTLVRALGSGNAVAAALSSLAAFEAQEGNTADALRYIQEAIELASWGKNAAELAAYHAQAAGYRIALGALDAARDQALDALHWAGQAQDELRMLDAIQLLAYTGAQRGDVQKAARLVGFVRAKCDALQDRPEGTPVWGWDRLAETLRRQLAEVTWNTLLAEGALWSDAQAAAVAAEAADVAAAA
jgi:predicted ATPase/class 3 adenylate cyclase